MKRWVGYFLSGLFVFLVSYKHDVVVDIFVFIKDLFIAFIDGAGKIIGSLL